MVILSASVERFSVSCMQDFFFFSFLFFLDTADFTCSSTEPCKFCSLGKIFLRTTLKYDISRIHDISRATWSAWIYCNKATTVYARPLTPMDILHVKQILQNINKTICYNISIMSTNKILKKKKTRKNTDTKHFVRPENL